ncbi:hypothetical protein JCM8547_004887 [Rhodosporidiobolus lusitaniae]
MDFGDAVHKMLAERRQHDQQQLAQTDGTSSTSSSTSSLAKPHPPPLSTLSVKGSTHATSSGASPAASRSNSPARPGKPSPSPLLLPLPHPPYSQPRTPTSPSRRISYNTFHPSALQHENGIHSPSSSRAQSTASSPTSRSPSRRHTVQEEYLLPPPTVSLGPPGREGLGLDTPRPKHKSQASFDWFGQAATRGVVPPPSSSLDHSLASPTSPGRFLSGLPQYFNDPSTSSSSTATPGASRAHPRQTDSPGRLPDGASISRSSSTSTTGGGFLSSSGGPGGKGKGKAGGPLDRRGKGKRGSSGDAPLTEESEWEEEAGGGGDARSPVSPSSGSHGGLRSLGTSGPNPAQQNEPKSPPRESPSGLRGAFTASDLERGARRLMGGDTESDVSSSGGQRGRSGSPAWKRRASALPASFRGVKKNKAEKGDKLGRTQSAGAAEGPGSGVPSPSLAQRDMEGKARSVHAGDEHEHDQEWEDEVRDQFDANGPSTSSAAAGGAAAKDRPVPGSRKSSLWGSAAQLFPHHVRPSESGSSTPHHPSSEYGDRDGDTQPGGGASTPKRPPQQRKGSAWNVVRERLKGEKVKKKKEAQGASLTGHELISELTTGVLPLVLVKMAVMDRDERGDRRIPILMNYLKLRITDSVYPFHDKHAIFRIELEYGDGAVKWVIYRELKDFVNLHAHYRVANLRQGIDKFPTFPKTSLPYLNWLKSERGGKGGVGKAEFARAQREALENYLLKLIKATMFGPGANRLCKFLEISAMSIMLSTRGGEQGKQGYLRITSSGASRKKPSGFHPLQWKKRHEPKWFIVRDSYIVAVDDPASTEIYDVIMVDSTFEIERPTRVYRKGLNLLGVDGSSSDDLSDPAMREGAIDLLANEQKPQGRRGAGDPNDPSSTGHRPLGGMGGKGAGALDKESEKVEGRDGEWGEKGGPEGSQARKEAVEEHAKAREKDDDFRGGEDLSSSSTHTFYLRSSERRLRLVAKTERQQDQFIASIEKMLAKTIWAGRNRFDSFAPIRLNVAAQWLIDGRDYFWSLSRAIALAKHKIYIHDWWLSPELYLRRPAIDNEKWRLDRLLQRKAREGVQIFVIVYKEVSNDFTPVESAYTKARLRGLHPNIHVQRSPSHTSTGTLLWSHHEKMCVIDETIGFMGGLDLCFGRWDTPGHVLIDDGSNPFNQDDPQNADRDQSQGTQIWPGKDYSNQRVLDFHTLSKPEEDMYDRGKVPRQPWHDIGLQIIGQPARDLCRHFIQRWNYLLRTKNHTVKMPFLLPAPDFTPQQLQELRITGTCEVQICRSVGPWSMGISHIEHSIQNAYIKAIQLSDHFVYIENQFFVTSTEVEGTVIENKIGDALVSRIVRAHSEGTPWRAMIIVPTVPGYPYPLDHSEAGSVRLIMECQYASICRGDHSIFARLRREGIDPDEYISFFGLRAWGKLSSGALTTESTYIHAKGMIVDDRIAIIGSANINERSQRGDRDSELACIIRDTDMIDSTMGGKPYQVGRFAHTMRVRLMREHLGIDVDELEAAEGRSELEAREPEQMQEKQDEWDPDDEQSHGTNRGAKAGKTFHFVESAAGSAENYASQTVRGATEAATRGLQKGVNKVSTDLKIGVDEAENRPPDEAEETKADRIVQGQEAGEGFASTVVPTLEEKMMAEHRPPPEHVEEGGIRKIRQQAEREREEGPTTASPSQKREAGEQENANDRPSHQPSSSKGASRPAQNGGEKNREQFSEVPSFDDQEEMAAKRRLGDEVTQSSNLDDTRKLPMQKDREVDPKKDAPPLSPIDEDEPNGQSKQIERPNVSPAKPRDDAAPPDVVKAHQGYRDRSKSTSTGGSETAKSSSSQQGGPKLDSSNKGHGNEQAVNRNEITGKLRRNLRERGAYTIPLPAPKIDPYGFTDPLVDSFYKDVWLAAAVRNTQIYRKVFRCMPDDLVQTWKQYREFQAWTERHNKAAKGAVPAGQEAPHSDPPGHSGQQGAGGGGSAGGVVGQGQNEPGETIAQENKNHPIAGSTAPGSTGGVSGVPGAKEARDYTQRAKDYVTGDNNAQGVTREADKHNHGGDGGDKRDNNNGSSHHPAFVSNNGSGEELEREVQRGSTITRRARSSTLAGIDEQPGSHTASSSTSGSGSGGNTGPAAGSGTEKKGRGRSGTFSGRNGREESSSGGGDGKKGEEQDLDDSFPQEEREQMEQLLEEVTGQLVVFPTRFLEAESLGGNFLFSKDRIPPIAIYD